MLHAAENDISSNARMKHYPALDILQVANAPIFKEPGWEPRQRTYSVPSKGKAKNTARSLEVSRARARRAVRDIALCNPFTHFFTWTLDPKCIDRYDVQAVQKKLEQTLRNLVQRKHFLYVCIPERHKDGALHFHGLCILGDVRLSRAITPSGACLSSSSGQPIYNMDDWPWGFSTCIPLDDSYIRAVNYVVKYINKDCEKIFGKWYLSARCLHKKPDVCLVDGVDYGTFIEANPDAYIRPLYRDVCISIKEYLPTNQASVRGAT